MRVIGKAAVMLGGAALAVAAGCFISPDELANKSCTNDGNCPTGYLCQPMEDGERRCLLQYPVPRDAGANADGGTAGPAVYYCTDIKPLLDYYCVTCHGPTNQQGGNFELDTYEPVGSTPGAYAMSGQIKYRVALARTMPPPDAGAFPSNEERLLFAQWVDAGAPECAPPDGGTDAGADAGRDAGTCTVVPRDGGYFATQIQPIFNSYCASCHFGATAWTWCNLVNVPANCNRNVQRVLPGDAGRSMLYLKITNDPTKCGNSMPNGQLPLSQLDPAATTKIRDWIVTGADAN